MNSSSVESAKPTNKDPSPFSPPFALGDVIKIIGALAVIIPLILGYLQYRQQVQENQNKAFREIVQNLSSKKKHDRLASASNLGTFIEGNNPYYDVAIDILVNTISIESDIDVLQAIRSSLEKISFSDYKEVIQKLLKLEQNTFIYEKYLSEKLRAEQKRSEEELQRYYALLAQHKWNVSHAEKTETEDEEENERSGQTKKSFTLEEIALELETYKMRYLESMNRQLGLELVNSEIPFRSELVTKFIASFLSVARDTPLPGLELYQNSWNYIVLSDLKLPEIIIKNSALGVANIVAVDFSHSIIDNSTFENSIIEQVNFSHSTINASLFNNMGSLNGTTFANAALTDVFFNLSDVKGADFSHSKGLKPIYFYKSRNRDLARFDPEFALLLEEEISKLTDANFQDYICDSKLSSQRQKELLSAVLDNRTGCDTP